MKLIDPQGNAEEFNDINELMEYSVRDSLLGSIIEAEFMDCIDKIPKNQEDYERAIFDFCLEYLTQIAEQNEWSII